MSSDEIYVVNHAKFPRIEIMNNDLVDGPLRIMFTSWQIEIGRKFEFYFDLTLEQIWDLLQPLFELIDENDADLVASRWERGLG